jgi:tetratricopeptide (TPR) repeat protein
LAQEARYPEAFETVGRIKEHRRIKRLSLYPYKYGLGYIEFVKGNYNEAAKYFKESSDLSFDPHYFIDFMLGRALYKAGRRSDAADLFTKLLNNYSENRFGWIFHSITTHYYLGLALEDSGRIDEAVKQYNLFLSYWGDADPEPEIVKDAKLRLNILKSEA